MSRAAIIGEPLRIQGYGLAGVIVLPASSAADAEAAWRSLPDDVEVVLLTARAAAWLGDLPRGHGVLPVVMPS
jgi:vacuolar-type H+-ATPase subunit F/Vma7